MSELKVFSVDELIDFITNMDDNTVIEFAAEYDDITDERGNIVDFDGTGWWNAAKLVYSDTATLLFNYCGGGYPFAYPIDGEDESETIENAVKRFMKESPDFELAELKGYLVDTEVKSLSAKSTQCEEEHAKSKEDAER